MRSGVYSICPVIAGVEIEGDWQVFRRAMFASLKPEGELENVLCERITLNAWRLRRVIRAESATLQAEADRLRKPVRELEEGRAWKLPVGKILKKLVRAGDDVEFSKDEAELVLWRALGTAKDELDDFELEVLIESFLEMLEGRDCWTAGGIREAVAMIAEQNELLLDDLMARMHTDAASDSDEYGKELAAAETEARLRQSACLIPAEETLAKIGRYESHLSRELFRCLHELQRLQGFRQGQWPSASEDLGLGTALTVGAVAPQVVD